MQKKTLTEEYLIEEYCRKKRTIENIATESGYSTYTVSRKLKQYKLRVPTEEKYINKKFGKLTPKRSLGLDKHSHLILECECDCGKLVPVLAYSLPTGNTTSCGCTSRKLGMNNENFKGYQEISATFWNTIVISAMSRGLSFEIDIKEMWELYLKQNRKCALSGISIVFAQSTKKSKYGTASLDRIDSSKGYIKNNVQWVHKRVNYMKQNMTEEDFLYWCILISNHMRGRENTITEGNIK